MWEEEKIYFQAQIKESLNYFEASLYKKDDFFKEPYLRSIFFEKLEEISFIEKEYKHNCLPCNLTDGLNLIRYFLHNNLDCEHIKFFVNIYSNLLYQQAEKFGVIYIQLGYKKNKNEFDWVKFPNLQKIKYWANFFKHPKSSMFLHHPTFYLENYEEKSNTGHDGVIDSLFVKKYYSGYKFNKNLEDILLNKRFIVLFPDLVEFTKLICIESINIIDVINSTKENIEKLKIYRRKTF